jgi:hypothetical protein
VFKKFALPCLLLFATLAISAQRLSSVRTQWSDSFAAWELYTFVPDTTAVDSTAVEEELEEEQVGTLQQRWLNVRDDWTEWDFTLADQSGTVKIKWKNDPSQWELRSFDGEVVTMQPVWRGDFSEWRVSNNEVTLDMKSRYTTQADEWLLSSTRHGTFNVYTLRRGDPRDWAVDDQLDDEVPATLKLALVFVAIYNSVPKE